MPDHVLRQVLLELEELLRVRHEKPLDGDAHLLRDDLRDRFAIDDRAAPPTRTRAGQIEKTDRFVGKRLLGHVTHGELDRGLHGRRLVRDAVVDLVARRDAT